MFIIKIKRMCRNLKKKIAIITPGFLPVPAVNGGGGEILITKLIDQNEVKKILDIDLYTLYDEKISSAQYKQTKIFFIYTSKIENIIAKIINKLANVLRKPIHVNIYGNKVSNILKKKKYDYLLIENNMYIFKKINENYPFKCKKVFHLHNDIGGLDKPTELCKYIGNNADLILTVSNYLKKRFLEFAPSNKIEVLYNCIDITKFNTKEEIRVKYRKKYKIKQNEFVFIYIGRLSEEKGPLLLIQAFKQLAHKSNNIKLCIVGDIWFNSKKTSPYLEKIKQESSSISSQIIFAGSQASKEIPKFMSMSDCVVVPTLCEEAFGLVAAEAMAAQRALIVSNSGGLIEVVDNSCAKIVNKDNFVENLATAMSEVADNPLITQKMGKSGYNRILKIKDFQDQYYLDNFCKKLKEIDN